MNKESFMKKLALFLAAIALVPAARAERPAPIAKHVVVIGIDGLGAYALRDSKNPVIDGLRERGAWTLHARGVMPTDSSPNWASMIMGAGPEQHGVTSNDWEPNKFDFPPTVVGTGGIFPTIFGVLRQQRPDAKIECFHEWDGFARLLEPKAVTVIEHGSSADDTARRAIQAIKRDKPDFLFVHFDLVDHAGHTFGHGTPEYYAAVAKADGLIGNILKTLEREDILSDTIVLVTADHGGRGKHHGGNSLAELEIPWIIAGPGIRHGHEIKSPVNTFDTAVTIAYIFKLKTPYGWIGRPALEAFDSAAGGVTPTLP
jgi:predicted AlkP superfamily pyrophosphatase or phosphodiesterase